MSEFRVRTTPLQVSCGVDETVSLYNEGPDTLSYGRTRAEAAAGASTIAASASQTFTHPVFVVSAGLSTVQRRVVDSTDDDVVDPSTGKLKESRVPDSVASKTEGAVPISILEDRFSCPDAGTSATAAIAAAVSTAASEGRPLKFPGRTYTLDTTLTISTSDVTLLLDEDAVFDGANATGTVLKIAGTTSGAAVAITGPTDPLLEDTFTIGLASAISGLAAGDRVRIASDEAWGNYTKSETREVSAVSGDGLTVTLKEALQDSYAISGQTITAQKMAPVRRVRVSGGEIRGGGTGGQQFGIELDRTENCEVRAVKVRSVERQGVRVVRSVDWLVSDNDIQGSNENALGYGITCAAERGRIIGNATRNCRHGIDVSGGTSAPISRGVIVANNAVSDCSSSGLSTHAGTEFCTWTGNTIEGCGGGIVLRSPRNTVVGNTIRGTRSSANSGAQTYQRGIWLALNLGGLGQVITGNIIDLGGKETFNAIDFSTLTGNIENTVIADNLLRNFGGFGIYANHTGHIRNLSITDNVIDCRAQIGTPGSTATHGIMIQAAADTYVKENVRISGNLIDTPLYDGIRLHGGFSSSYRATGIVVTGNVFKNVPLSGVNLANGHFGAGVIVAGNSSPGITTSTVNQTTQSSCVYVPLTNFGTEPTIYGNSYGSRKGSFVAVGDVEIWPAGKGLRIPTGSNARMGTATLVGGTVTVSNTSVTANTVVLLSRATTGGTVGHLSTTLSAGASFTINSSSGSETSTVNWLLIEPTSAT